MKQSSTPSRSLTWIVTVGLLLVAAGTIMPFFMPGDKTFRWIYGAGAIISLVGRILTPYNGNVLRIKRLCRIEMWASIFFCAATVFMFYPGAGARDWLAFTLAGGCVLVYTSIMIPREQSKAKKGLSNKK